VRVQFFDEGLFAVSITRQHDGGNKVKPKTVYNLRHTISVQQFHEFIFAIHKYYNSARKFAERLSIFLTFSLDDSMPSAYRK